MYKLKYFYFVGKTCKHRGECTIEDATLDGAIAQVEVLVDRIFPHLSDRWGQWTDTEVHETETHRNCKMKRYAHLFSGAIGRIELHWENEKGES